jgi:hypothetical protein
VAAATFVVIAVPFMVDQVRTAIYPSLEIERTLALPLSSGSPLCNAPPVSSHELGL